MRNCNVFAAMAVGLLGVSAQAATITIRPVAKAYWPVGSDPFSVAPTPNSFRGSPGTYQIDIQVSTVLSSSDIAGGWTGLGQLSFSMTKQAGGSAISYSPDLGYSPYLLKQNAAGTRVSCMDPLTGMNFTKGTDAAAGIPVVTDGGDIGPSDSDYKYLYFEAGGVQSVIGRTLTQSTQDSKVTALLGNPMSIGTFLVTYDATMFAILKPVLNVGEGANLANGSGGFQDTAQAAGNNYVFGDLWFPDWPEPASLSFVAFAGLGFVRRRRQ